VASGHEHFGLCAITKPPLLAASLSHFGDSLGLQCILKVKVLLKKKFKFSRKKGKYLVYFIKIFLKYYKIIETNIKIYANLHKIKKK